MSELKAGDSLDFKIGDKTLTIEPVPYGQIKKILRTVLTLSGETKVTDVAIIGIVDKYTSQILPLMFPKGKYDFLTDAWVEDNMTIPVLRKMLESAIVVNGLQDFFEKLVGHPLTPVPSSPSATTIPPAKDGSTTSVDSPTDGALKT
jgi:hypothetical protein